MPTKRIHCIVAFLDDRDRIEAGEIRVVEESRAERFIAAGWASVDGLQGDISAPPQHLNIQGAVIGQETRHG